MDKSERYFQVWYVFCVFRKRQQSSWLDESAYIVEKKLSTPLVAIENGR